MNTTTVHLPHESTIIWAIIASVLLHALLAVVIPNIEFEPIETPDVLEIALVKKPEPPPVIPEPVTPPEPVKPKVEPKPEPKVKPQPLPKPIPVVDTPTPTPPPPANVPEVIAVPPKVEAPTPPPITTPPPLKQETPVPTVSQADLDGARDRYSNALWGAISKHKKYPKIAQMRGWQGEASVELELDGSGKVKSKKIAQSSGYEVLDKQALEMVEKALPLPVPPEVLRGNSFTIIVPVPFRLE